MSTMPATHGHNEACCNIPPVVSTGYQAKGTYEEDLGGYKTYVTGPPDATKGIVSVYDIFGYFDQTLQGADILAASDPARPHLVFMPDWFRGAPVPIASYPPDTPAKQQQLSDFFARHRPALTAAALPAYVAALQARYPRVASWAVIGYCWGGKVVALATAAAATPFAAAACVHPAMVEPADAPAVAVPLVLLASKEEPDDKVAAFADALTVPHHVETFKDQIHGWMSARADLADERVRDEYARGYRTVLEFWAREWK